MQKHKSTIKRILAYIGHYKWGVLASLVLAAITVASTLYLPVLIGLCRGLHCFRRSCGFHKTDRNPWKNGSYDCHHCHFPVADEPYQQRDHLPVVKDIRTKAFDHLEILPLKYIDSHPSGDVVSRIIADIDQFSEGLLMGFTQLFTV